MASRLDTRSDPESILPMDSKYDKLRYAPDEYDPAIDKSERTYVSNVWFNYVGLLYRYRTRLIPVDVFIMKNGYNRCPKCDSPQKSYDTATRILRMWTSIDYNYYLKHPVGHSPDDDTDYYKLRLIFEHCSSYIITLDDEKLFSSMEEEQGLINPGNDNDIDDDEEKLVQGTIKQWRRGNMIVLVNLGQEKKGPEPLNECACIPPQRYIQYHSDFFSYCLAYDVFFMTPILLRHPLFRCFPRDSIEIILLYL